MIRRFSDNFEDVPLEIVRRYAHTEEVERIKRTVFQRKDVGKLIYESLGDEFNDLMAYYQVQDALRTDDLQLKELYDAAEDILGAPAAPINVDAAAIIESSEKLSVTLEQRLEDLKSRSIHAELLTTPKRRGTKHRALIRVHRYAQTKHDYKRDGLLTLTYNS